MPSARLHALALAALSFALYRSALPAPFVFDDEPGIVLNRRLRDAWPPWAPMRSPPPYTAVSTRAVANYTFALNHAACGPSPRGFRIVNVAIHAACALLLYGLVRRTLALPAMRDRFGDAADRTAFLAAAL